VKALQRAVDLVFLPGEAWQKIAREEPDPAELIRGFALPMACIPAVCWAVGTTLFAGKGVVGADVSGFDFGAALHGGAIALAGVAASIFLLAVSIFILAPLFARTRTWRRILQVAVYSSAPVLLAGVLLVLPDLVFALMISAAHSFYLLYAGFQHVLGVKQGEAAEYAALVAVLVIIASTLLGAFASWLGMV